MRTTIVITMITTLAQYHYICYYYYRSMNLSLTQTPPKVQSERSKNYHEMLLL